MNEYESEVKERWGKTLAYKQSKERTSKYSADDLEKAKLEQEAVTNAFLLCFKAGNSANSPEVQKVVISHRNAITNWYYECSPEMQKNLAAMYLSDERFKKFYDDRADGLAQFVHDAIMAQ